MSLDDERLERRLSLVLGFSATIPIALIYWAIMTEIPLELAVFPLAGSVLLGYLVIRRTLISVIRVTEKVKSAARGETFTQIDHTESPNELGELARTFNRITRDLERKVTELEESRQLVKQLLSRIGSALGSYEGIDSLLDLIMENTVAALQAQMGSLLVVDGESQELAVKSAWSSNGRLLDHDGRFKLGQGIPGWVAQEGRAVRGSGDPTALGFNGSGSDRTGTVLCVPLRLRDCPMGAMGVLRESIDRPFTEDDELLLQSIGAQVSVAIENYRLNLDIERTYVETIMALALAVEAKDPYSAGHSKRVGFYAMKIGEQMGLDKDTQKALNDAGVLHDIGKIGIRDEILLKPEALTRDEQQIMEQHPLIGEAILKPVRSMRKAMALVRHHHERYDGRGYPSGLKGAEIPLGARILAVADTWDAMITDRPYRKRLPLAVAAEELRKLSGVQFDPGAVVAFLKVLEEKDARRMAQLTPGAAEVSPAQVDPA